MYWGFYIALGLTIVLWSNQAIRPVILGFLLLLGREMMSKYLSVVFPLVFNLTIKVFILNDNR